MDFGRKSQGGRDMSMDAISGTQSVAGYDSYGKTATKTVEKKDAKETAPEVNAVYEKSGESAKKPTYSINKMSASDRQALVSQLNAEQERRQASFVNMVHEMIAGQGKAYSMATGDDSIWKFLASGDFTVDAATKAQAQQDISEDGYWGVKQTSQRLFDFASALAGDDVEKMKKMQAAMEKGFRQATAAWGKSLPSISQETMAAANKLFDDYYASK